MWSWRKFVFFVPSMKLRVRINRQTSRVELPGGEPTLQELSDLIKQTLSSYGLRSGLKMDLSQLSVNWSSLFSFVHLFPLSTDTEFSLSLNGSELLSDSGQTLSSCGIVSGDLICVLLPHPPPVATATPEMTTSSASRTTNFQQTSGTTTCQVRSEKRCFLFQN